MAISINWGSLEITVPQSYLTSLGGGIYELDTDQFRLDLKDLEDSEEGIAHPDTHYHNAAVTVSGVTLAQVFVIINGYTVTFEDGQYAVNFVGSNNNLYDVTNVNQVSIRPFNSAGLIQVTSGSGVLPQDITDIVQGVWSDNDAYAVGTKGRKQDDTNDNAEVTQGKVDQL